MIYSAIALILSASALTACSSDDGVTGDPARNWAGTTTAFTPTDEQGFGTYYMPAIGRVGDPMPFYDKKAGDFKVLYLQEFDNNMSHRFHPICATGRGAATCYGSSFSPAPWESRSLCTVP